MKVQPTELPSNSSALDAAEYSAYRFNDSSYDYDPEEALSIFYWEELLPPLLVYVLTFMLGVSGNLIIIITISRIKRMKSTTNAFLVSLASADLLLIIICIPVKLFRVFSYTWGMGPVMCKMLYYMQSVSSFCSVLTLTAMSLERYYAIVYPLRAQYVCTMAHAKKVIFVIWIMAFILATPILYIQVLVPVGERYVAYWCVRDWSGTLLWRSYEVYQFVTVLMVPSIIMGLSYVAICKKIHAMMLERRAMSNGGEIHRSSMHKSFKNKDHSSIYKQTTKMDTLKVENLTTSLKKAEAGKTSLSVTDNDSSTMRQVVKMLVVVVILFLVCWGPLLIVNLLTAFGIVSELNYGYIRHLRLAIHLMAYLNSCMNPFIYGFMSRNFRNSIRVAFFLCCRKTHPTRGRFTSANSNLTSVRYSSYHMSSFPTRNNSAFNRPINAGERETRLTH